MALSTVTLELLEPEPLARTGFLDPIRRALADSPELLGGSIAALQVLVVVAAPRAHRARQAEHATFRMASAPGAGGRKAHEHALPAACPVRYGAQHVFG